MLMKLKNFMRLKAEKDVPDKPSGCIRKRGNKWIILNNKKGGRNGKKECEYEC